MSIKKNSIVTFYNEKFIVKSVNKKSYTLFKNTFSRNVSLNAVLIDENSFQINDMIYTVENERLYDQFNTYIELSELMILFNNFKSLPNCNSKNLMLFDRYINFKTVRKIVKMVQDVNKFKFN